MKVHEMMTRREILRKIDRLISANCRDCREYVYRGVRASNMTLCVRTCPVGKKLQKLGDELLNETIERRKRAKEVKASNDPNATNKCVQSTDSVD